ncbi:copper-binding protein [Salmonella enterica]|nr:copper-binding protein [Salmonella enterica]
MKKIMIAAAISMSIVSSVWASQTPMSGMDMEQDVAQSFSSMNEHEQAMIAYETMNNGSANAHQQMVDAHKKMMGEKLPEKKEDIAQSFSSMNEHEQAMIAHETMNNGSANAHQQMVNAHKKMMGEKLPEKKEDVAQSFSSMNEHEQAAVVHEFTKNGQSVSFVFSL